jgi:exopolysaccharide biosynthesis polyprenyl glycosylphosphotransferase
VKYPKYKILLAILDFLIIRISFTAAMQVRGVSLVHSGNWMYYILSPEFYFFFVYSGIIILIFQNKNLYDINIVLTRSRQLVLLSSSCLYAVLGLAIVAFFVRSSWILDSRLTVILFGLFSFTVLAVYRLFVFRPLFRTLKHLRRLRKNVLIVGTGQIAKRLVIEMELDGIYGLNLLGFVDDAQPVGKKIFEKYAVVGKVNDAARLVHDLNVQEIIVTSCEINHEELMRIIDVCKETDAQVRIISSLFDVVHQKGYSESYYDIPAASVRNPRESRIQIFSKRIVDFFAAFFGILILSIPFLVIAGMIKLTSRGPVLYSQARIGKDGKKFSLYKFRSMYKGSDADHDHVTKVTEYIKRKNNKKNGSLKIVNENNITPIGKNLRKMSLDELPQLFNVLKGDMSLVGPRPCVPYEFDAYDNWHKRRLSVLPGCTGLWQVTSRSEVGFDDMVLLDLYYINNMSPWLDLQLILKTVPVMIFGRGGG